MSEKMKAILTQTAIKTFEELVFLFAFAEAEADTSQAKGVAVARVGFSGDFSGTLDIKLSAEVLPELTANMLGVDDDEETTLDQQYDALKETLNVICGNLLPAIAGKQKIFNIDPPEIISTEEAIKTNIGQKAACNVTLSLDGEKCTLVLFTDDRFSIDAPIS